MRPSLFLPALALPLLAMTVCAHDPGFSTAIVTVGAREIEAVVTYSFKEIQGDPALLETAAFQINDDVPEASTHEFKGDDQNLIYRIVSPRPADGIVTLSAPFLEQLAPGHRQHLLVRDEEKAVLLNQFLQRGEPSATLNLPPLPKDASRLNPVLAIALEVLAISIALWLVLYLTPHRRSITPRST
jgi:hypothetical protein